MHAYRRRVVHCPPSLLTTAFVLFFGSDDPLVLAVDALREHRGLMYQSDGRTFDHN